MCRLRSANAVMSMVSSRDPYVMAVALAVLCDPLPHRRRFGHYLRRRSARKHTGLSADARRNTLRPCNPDRVNDANLSGALLLVEEEAVHGAALLWVMRQVCFGELATCW